MPSFTLKVVDFPKSVSELKYKLSFAYGGKPNGLVGHDLNHVLSDRNVHVTIPFNMHVTCKRTKTLSRAKSWIFMDSYREIFKRDAFYVY